MDNDDENSIIDGQIEIGELLYRNYDPEPEEEKRDSTILDGQTNFFEDSEVEMKKKDDKKELLKKMSKGKVDNREQALLSRLSHKDSLDMAVKKQKGEKVSLGKTTKQTANEKKADSVKVKQTGQKVNSKKQDKSFKKEIPLKADKVDESKAKKQVKDSEKKQDKVTTASKKGALNDKVKSVSLNSTGTKNR